MNEENLKQEKEMLNSFLAERGYHIRDLESQLKEPYFAECISSLVIMGEILEAAAKYAREMGDVEETADLGARAMAQKDTVYSNLILALGVTTESIKLENGTYLTIINPDSLDYLIRAYEEGPLKTFGDYISKRFETGIIKCETILSAQDN